MSVNLGGMQSLSLMTGGIDYSQIVSQLYQADRAPGDALNAQIQTDQLKQNDWQSVAKLASTLQNDLVTLASASTFNSSTATVTGTNSSDVTATVGANATAGTYNIAITQQLTNGAVTSGAQLGNAVTLSTPMTSSVFSQAISLGTTLSVTEGTTTRSYTVQSGDTLNSIMSALFPTGSNVTWSIPTTGANADQLQVTNNSGQTITFGSAGDTNNLFQAIGLAGQVVSSTSGSVANSGLLGHAQLNQTLDSGNFAQALTYSGAGTIAINGVNIDYNTSTDTLQQLINNINSSTAGVTASYDVINDKLTLTSKTSQPISVSDAPTTSNPAQTNNLAEVLGLSSTSAVAPIVTTGQPWQYSINGGPTTTSASSTISNVIPGVTLNLSAPANSISGTTTSLTATVSVAQDSSVLTKAVNQFAADFNSLYTQLQQYTGKGGDLQGDGAVAQLAFNYMNDVLDPVSTTPTYAQSSVMGIGISNGPIGSAPGTTNTLQVDTNALTTAFQNNPNEVQALLQGMATRLNQSLVNLTGNFNTLTPVTAATMNSMGVAQAQENLYGQMITDTEQQQQQIYDQASQQETILQQQFTALQQFQQQSSMQQSAISAMINSTLS